MSYRGPGFLSTPRLPPFTPLPSASCLSFSVILYVAGRELTFEGAWGGQGDESYDSAKAWPSIIYSILSAQQPFVCIHVQVYVMGTLSKRICHIQLSFWLL
jgi:hypothetical protein